MAGVKTWDILAKEEQEDYFKEAEEAVQAERDAGKRIYPPKEDVFNAFRLTDFAAVKAVILGQDPYHGEGQAHGFAFSVKRSVAVPPSLKNIYKELEADTNIEGFKPPKHGCLLSWAKQGVLLLNTVLTVERGQPNSHAGIGWQNFTDAVIKTLSDRCEGLVFLLWGKSAGQKSALINTNRHHILSAAHPSPFSAHRGFLGCGHFSETNRILERQGVSPINWAVE